MMCDAFRHGDRWSRRSSWSTGGDTDVVRTVAGRRSGPAADRDLDLRVSQAERDEVARALASHFADGRLTLGEYEERVQAALEARTGRDLEPLLADLPGGYRPGGTRSRPEPGRRRPARRQGGWPVARVVAVAAVLLLAVSAGPWALWLLWPALVLTGAGPCGSRAHRARWVDDRRPVTQRL